MKKFTILFVLLFLSWVGKAQVTVTPAPLLNNLCVGASAYTTIGGDIIITKNANGDIPDTGGTPQDVVFTMPANFELETGTGAASIIGGGTSTATATITATTITVTFATSDNTASELRVTGIKARAITSASTGDMTVTTAGGINFSVGTIVVGSFSSIAPPSVSVFGSGTSICLGKALFFVAVASGATQYEFVVKQGLTTIDTQAYSITNFYTTSTSLASGSYNLEVKAKNASNCESTVNTTAFTVTALPTSPTITSPQNFCLNSPASTSLTATGSGTIRWYNSPALTTPIRTGGTVTLNGTLDGLGVNPAVVGTHVFYITSFDGTCESIPTPLVVNITALPTLVVFDSGTTICEGNTVFFFASGTGTEYQFVLKKGGTTIDTKAYSTESFYETSNTLIAGNDYTMEVTTKDANSCESTINSTPFVINALPASPTFASTTIQYCVGDDLSTKNITANSIVSGYLVEWFEDAFLATMATSNTATGTSQTITANTLNISSASTFTYTRYVTQTNPVTGCRSLPTEITIEIVAKPTVSLFRSPSTSICAGETVTYTAFSPTAVSYTFTLRNGLTVIETVGPSASNTYTPPSTLTFGTYNVFVVVTNAAGCQVTSLTNFLGVLPKPNVNFPTPSTTSFAETDTSPVTLTATETTGAVGTGVFSGPGVSGNQFFPNLSGGAGSKIITYTFTSSNGCKDSKFITFTINTGGFFVSQGYCQDAGQTSFIIPSFCPTATVTDVFPYSVANGNPIQNIAGTFYFNPSLITIPVGQDFVFWEGAILAPVCASYYYYINTRIFRSATPSISGSNVVCRNDDVVYTTPAHTFNNTTGTVTYTWSFDTSGGAVAGTILSGQGTNTVTVRWGTAGAGKLQVAQTINYTSPVVNSCAKTDLYNVTINPLPTGSITPTTAVCQGSTVAYTATAGFNYNWTVTGGTIVGSATNQTANVLWSESATAGAVFVTLTNPTTGCQRIVNTSSITLNPRPTPTFNNGSFDVCQNEYNYYSTPEVVGNTYLWTVSPTASATIYDPTTYGTGVVWNSAGTISLTETTPDGCSQIISNAVTTKPKPANIITGTNTVCEDNVYTYTTSTGVGNQYSWYAFNGSVEGTSANTASIRWNIGATSGQVECYIFNTTTNCSNYTSFPVSINTLPAPNVTGSSPVCAASTNLYQTTNNVGSTYTWTVVNTNNVPVPFTVVSGNPHQINVTWGTTASGTVTVEETNASGCTDKNSKTVILNPLPLPAIIGELETCATRERDYVTPNVAGNTYIWTVTGGTIISGATSNICKIQWGTGVAGTITLEETITLTGCKKTVTENVIIRALPAPVISGATSVCQSQTGVVYSVPNVAGHTYSWDIVGGTINSGLGTNSISVTWGTGNNGRIIIEQQDGNFSTNCTKREIVNVTINPLPNPVIVGSPVVCANSTNVVYNVTLVSGHTYAWSVVGGTIIGSSTGNSIVVNWGSNPTGAQVQIIQTDGNFTTNCSKTVVLPIGINALSTPSITPSTSTCAGSTVVYQTSAGSPSYSWSVTNGTITNGQGTNQITVQWSTSSASGIIQVVQTLGTGCSNVDSKTIILNPLPTPAITGNFTVCEIDAAIETYTTTNNVGSTYTWVVTGGSATAGAMPNQVNVQWGTNGTGTVKVTETTNFGCAREVTQNITINKKPNPAITPTDDVCEFTNNNIYQTTLNTGSNYVWTITGAISHTATNNQVSVNWGTSGVGTLRVQETDANGCVQTTPIQNINKRALPNPSISGASELCENTQGVVYSVGAAVNNAYNWTVTGGAIVAGQGTNSITINWGNAGVGNVSIVQTDNNFSTACNKSTNVNVNLRAIPTPTIVGSNVVCAQTTGAVYSVTSVAGHEYIWNVPGGIITSIVTPTSNSITVNWGSNPAGAQVQVTQINKNFPTNCARVATLPILINPLPTPAITPTNDVCALSSQTYQTTSNAGSTYNWSIVGGTITSTLIPTSNSVNVTWGNAGGGSLTVTETNSFTCQTTTTITPNIRSLPTPNIVGTLELCAGTTGANYSVVASAGNSYEWVVTGGTIVGSNTNDNITVNWGNAGTGNIQVTQTDNNFGTLCKTVNSKIVNIRPLPTPIIIGNHEVCAQTTGSIYSVPAVAGHEYIWTVVGGTITSAITPTSNTITVTWGSNTTGAQVQVVQTDKNFPTNCPAVSIKPVLINPLPTPFFNADNICESSLNVVYETVNNANSTYAWSVTGGTVISGAGTHKITVNWGLASAVGGNATVSLTETTNKGCVTTFTDNFTLYALPTPSIMEVNANPFPFEACETTVNNQYQTANVVGSIYIWTVNGGTFDIVGAEPYKIKVAWDTTSVNAGAGLITLKEINANGCERTVTRNILINAKPNPAITSTNVTFNGGTGKFDVCALDQNTTFQTPLVAGNTYQWSVSGNTNTINATSNQITVNWAETAINPYVEVTQTNAKGCVQVIRTYVNLRPLPNPIITGDPQVCAQSTNIVYSVTAVANHAYFWTVNGGTITSVTTPTSNTITVTWGSSTTGNEVIIRQVNTLTGCEKTVTRPITILPLPAPIITGATTVCASEGTGLNVNEYVYTTALVTGNTYDWTVTNGIIVGPANGNQITIRWNNNATSGNIRVLQTTPTVPACQTFTENPITINSLPITDFTMANFCKDETTIFTPTITNPAWAWEWKFSDGTTYTTPSVNKVFANLGNFTATLIARTPQGCEYEVEKNLTIHPVPVAKFSYSNTCQNGNATQFTDLSTVATLPLTATANSIISWQWEFGDQANTQSALQNPTFTYLPGVYTVKLTVNTNNGCTHNYSEVIRVYPQVKPTDAVPYVQDFQASEGGWLAHGTNNSWGYGRPNGRTVQTNVGEKILTTGLSADYTNNQKSYVESPCFDLTDATLTRPMIAFDYWTDSENKADGAVVLYSINQGTTWKLLGKQGRGVEWYNEENILSLGEGDNSSRIGWTGKTHSITQPNGWRTAKYSLDSIKTEVGANTVRFRIAFSSNADNPIGQNLDGFAFDNVYIGNRQQRALVEHFTTMESTSENELIDNFSNEATKLQYHMKGQLYNDNQADATARALLYGVNVPDKDNTRGALNGDANTNTLLSQWLPQASEAQLLGTPIFEMKLDYEPTPADKLNVKIDVKSIYKYEEDIVLHIVMVEDSIMLPTGKFKNVVKKMIPSAAGKPIRIDWTAGLTQTYNESITLYDLSQSTPLAPKFYDWTKLKMVAFIQDFKTNEVLQVVEKAPTLPLPSRVTALAADDGQGSCLIYPNPAKDEVFVGFNTEAMRTYNWEIQTLQGNSMGHGTIVKGEQGATIDTQKYPSGMYIVKITNPQNKTSWVGKLIIKK
jgi:hypothetical protein